MGAVTEVAATCSCGSIGASGLRLCSDHHRYFDGDRELVSVSRVIREAWPIKKNFEGADPAVLEHARERGSRVDAYFSAFLTSGRVSIPAGEWVEVIDRTRALVEWWEKQNLGAGKAQVMMTDGEFAGTADIIAGDMVMDLKNVSALDPSYWIQVGSYLDFSGCNLGGLIHVTQPRRNGELQPVSVKLVPVEVEQARADWRLLRDTWRMCQKRAGLR